MNKFITAAFITLLNLTIWAQDQTPFVKWKFQTNGSIRSEAVVLEDKIYLGNSAGTIYCLHNSTGELIWQYKTKGAIVAAPFVAKSNVYVTSRDNHVYCLKAENGELIWKYKMEPILPAPFGGWEYFAASPVVSGNKVFIGSGDGHLYALNSKNGGLVWKYKTDRRIRATPLVVENTIYQPSNEGFLYAINAKNGELLWKFATDGASYDSYKFGFDRNSMFDKPNIRGNTLVFGSRDGNTYAIDITTQKVKWKFSYGSTWAMSSTLDENSAYIGWSTNDFICAIDLETGEEKWKFQCGSHVYTTPLLLEDHVIVGSADGLLYKLNKNTGKKTWTYDAGKEIFSSPVEQDGTIYFGSDNGILFALEEGSKPYKAIYLPDSISGNAQYLVVDPKIAPFLEARGFEKLNEKKLYNFISERLIDHAPSVLVFGLPLIPAELIDDRNETSLIRQYLDDGGKIVWFGDVPNFYEPDSTGQFNRDQKSGTKLLDVQYAAPGESGNYFCQSTQQGLNWGLPVWFKSTHAVVVPSDDITVLSYDEYDRPAVWNKKFHPRMGSGFVSCRTWSWNVPIREEDLEIIHRVAVYGLE